MTSSSLTFSICCDLFRWLGGFYRGFAKIAKFAIERNKLREQSNNVSSKKYIINTCPLSVDYGISYLLTSGL